MQKGLLSRNSDSENDDNNFTPPEPTSNKLGDHIIIKSDNQTGASQNELGSQDEHFEEEFEEEIEEIIEEIDDDDMDEDNQHSFGDDANPPNRSKRSNKNIEGGVPVIHINGSSPKQARESQ